MAVQKEFYIGTDLSSTTNSDSVSVLSKSYSIQVNLTGTVFDVDSKIQISLDGLNWVDAEGSSVANIVNDGSIIYDYNAGLHRFARVVITRNSGTFSFSCFISDGGWKNV